MQQAFRKAITTAFLIFLATLLSGCITVKATQKIARNGKAALRFVYDTSQLKQSVEEIAQGVGEGGEGTVSSLNCESLHVEEIVIQKVKCVEKDEYTVVITGVTKLKQPAFTVKKSETKTTYTYQVNDILRLLSTPDNLITIESLKKDQATIALTGAKFTYTIFMPGVITHTDIGKKKKNGVRFNFMDLTKKPDAIIRSEELNGE